MTEVTASPTGRPDLHEQFERDGFVVVRALFTPEEVNTIGEAFMTAAAAGPVEGLSDVPKGATANDPLAAYPRMLHPHKHEQLEVGRLAKDFLLDPRVGAILEVLFGEEPLAAQTMFYFKPPGARGQALHQDNFYLRVSPGTCMAAWLAVDDADEHNGGMVVVPGSHHLDVACPERADPNVSFVRDVVPVPDGLDEVTVRLRAGDVLFFNGSLIHGSYPNTSADRFRRSLIAHYVPASCEEVSSWYRPLLRFDQQAVEVAAATGGGPCGDFQEVGGPH
ncbi:phytanoyl-CoA dioxygenase family protein [Deinococcus pimensis]|uniref:phytanoyl-CoA dioxygenase family protein n=1 Tax=Deinococcus pimensis TaxID=309888 RepID=UPI0004B6E572|nr:phytanoyl-CoA dioxygenase family protein [Deinococcus pimensis]